jgi:hypothetical protein
MIVATIGLYQSSHKDEFFLSVSLLISVTAQAETFAGNNPQKKGMHVGRTPHMHTFLPNLSPRMSSY